jgi:hypothetical protein
MNPIEFFAHQAFDFLQCTDCETDLSEIKENEWSPRLASRLAALQGSTDLVYCDDDRVYPGSRDEYDFQLRFRNGHRLFVEVKQLFPTYWKRRGWFNRHLQRLYYPIDPTVELGRSPKNSAAIDLWKLATLTPSDTTHVALLIMSSHYHDYDMHGDYARFTELAEIHCAPWAVNSRKWANHHVPGYYYDVRCWGCSYEELKNWWLRVGSRFSH